LSRNKDRLGGGPHSNNSQTPAPLTQNNDSDGFSFVLPTEFVELPSGGRYYPENHPLHNQETIEIKHMTAKEEDILTSRALLKKGVAVDRLLQSIILNKQIDPKGLLVGDRNAIMIASRISGYGSEYTTKIECPACGTSQSYEFDLHDLEPYEGFGIDNESDVVNNNDGTFTTTLPRTKLEITFRLLTGFDEAKLTKLAETARKAKREENAISTQLKHLIVAVNGDDSRKAVNYIAENMPSSDSRRLRFLFSLASPTIDMTQHFECSACDHEQELEVPLTADFFWPDR
tara:strand:+ start:1733 stop:2596 length:864 start_codon:yes stop_codon:yes gene_type:complete